MSVGAIVLHASGPGSVTKAAAMRACALVGPAGLVVAVGATRGGLGRHADLRRLGVEIVESHAREGVDTALAQAESAAEGPVLFVHDDALVTPPALERMIAAHERTGWIVVPYSNDPGTDHLMPGDLAGGMGPARRAHAVVAGLQRAAAVDSGLLPERRCARQRELPARYGRGPATARATPLGRRVHGPAVTGSAVHHRRRRGRRARQCVRGPAGRPARAGRPSPARRRVDRP